MALRDRQDFNQKKKKKTEDQRIEGVTDGKRTRRESKGFFRQMMTHMTKERCHEGFLYSE